MIEKPTETVFIALDQKLAQIKTSTIRKLPAAVDGLETDLNYLRVQVDGLYAQLAEVEQIETTAELAQDDLQSEIDSLKEDFREMGDELVQFCKELEDVKMSAYFDVLERVRELAQKMRLKDDTLKPAEKAQDVVAAK